MIIVKHSGGEYPVYVEPGILGRLPTLLKEHLADRRVAMLADTVVHGLYQSGQWGTPRATAEAITFPPGEASKTRECWARLTDTLLQRGFGRDSGVMALGGGVTGDLAGFVAATYMRGLPFVQVPTTLLAMVDASVGGKTGVDTPRGKNLVGAYHHPKAVVTDPGVLDTLPDRAFRAGLAEAVKHGLIADAAYFQWMEEHAEPIAARDHAALAQLVQRSVEIKAGVVNADEREAGYRAILNAGHTVAHALEQVSGFELPHGEAVAIGLVVECRLAEELGVARRGLEKRVMQLLIRFGLPARPGGPVDSGPLLEAMRTDKKNHSGRLHFALPADLGRMHREERWTTAVAEGAIRHAWDPRS